MAKPTHCSTIPRDTDLSAARLGASMLGLPLTPQGERIAGVLEARRGGGSRYPEVVVQLPRRAAKTTSVWSVLIGRAMTRPGWRCVTTAQSGTIASTIILEFGNALEARGYREDGTLRLYRNGGRERLEFGNGSRVWVVPPEPGAVRSAAADCIVVDEAGEHDGTRGTAFLDAVRPLMDTRGDLAQLVVSGTPGRVRSGMFWETLEAARCKADRDLGIVDYSARDDEDPEDRRLWRRVHPGPSSGLTPMKVLEKRRASMDLASFSREYLCAWPADASTGALDVGAWSSSGADFPDARPSRSVIAIDAPKDQSCCAVLEVWREDDGKARAEVLAFRPGVSWAARFAHQAALEARAPVVFDEIGGNVTIAAEIRRLRPSVRVEPLRTREVGGAAQLLATEIREGRFVHFDQPDLTSAVEACGWRPMGRDGRAFGRRPGSGEISPAVAASFGLWAFDQLPARGSTRLIVA